MRRLSGVLAAFLIIAAACETGPGTLTAAQNAAAVDQHLSTPTTAPAAAETLDAAIDRIWGPHAEIARRVIQCESAYQVNALGGHDAEVGLMQIMPLHAGMERTTAAYATVTIHGVDWAGAPRTRHYRPSGKRAEWWWTAGGYDWATLAVDPIVALEVGREVFDARARYWPHLNPWEGWSCWRNSEWVRHG